MKWIAFIVLVLAVFSYGCVTANQKLGCCLRGNLTQGCVLYNVSDTMNPPRDLISNTTTIPCDMITGCNVTLKGMNYTIPVCTEEDLSTCTSGECTAMVCGDFAYKPRVSPGIGSVEDSEGDAPPNLQDEAAAYQFYKAQCRFLPMDADLRQIMKSSKSQINVFRLGVGGSFDEFDQYRYYFPISDKFCNINPPLQEGDRRVDRYMNFLQGDGSEYLNPETDIVENCVDGSGDPPPATFAESTATKNNYLVGNFQPVVPDAENYKFAHYARTSINARFVPDNGGYYAYPLGDYYNDQSKIFKKIDEAYYKRQLNIAHTTSMYGLNGTTDTTRAPFECDPGANECYSGSCNIQTHNRGVNVRFPGLAEGGAEVVTDCNKVQDENGETRVICPPTKTVTANGNNPPTITYAGVTARPAHLETNLSSTSGSTSWFPFAFSSLASDSKVFDPYWGNFSNMFSVDHVGTSRTVTNTFSSMYYYYLMRKYCPGDYPGQNTSNTTSLCSSYYESSSLPPVGGFTFFGKLKDDKTVKYNGSSFDIIGYGLTTTSEFNETLFVKNCAINMTNISPMTSNYYETNDFIRVQLDGPDDPDWADLMSAFKPYFEDRMDAAAKKATIQCNNYLSSADAVVSSIPWVIGYQKGLNDPEISLGSLFDPDYSYSSYYLYPLNSHITSSMAETYRSRNVYEQPMASMSGNSACDVSPDTQWWWGYWNQPTFYYNIAFSRYVYLFKYQQGSKKIGSCAVDDTKFLPEMKTFGWCEPCTTSTLAYQNITARDRVYMPYISAKVENSSVINPAIMCNPQYNGNWVGFMDFHVTDNVTCVYDPVTDISEYTGSIGGLGSPRTIPDATIIKERTGIYMKSGILPIFDLSDASNWNLNNPDSNAEDDDGNSIFCLFYFDSCNDAKTYPQYDFERLFGNMGASIVIVDHVTDSNDAFAKVDEIKERSAVVRERCTGCLTAFHVDNPASNDSFKDSLTAVLDPQASFTIDMVTFDYKVSDHATIAAEGPEAVAKDIESYARMALQSKKKPTMVVGFNVENNGGTYTDANFKDLFEKVVERQAELVKAGLVGIIYAPARGPSGSDGQGIVSLDGSGLGTKTAKFCALEDAMYKMTTIPPNALFTKVIALGNVTCEQCTGLDKTQHNCGPPTGEPLPVCDNGASCTLPDPVPSGMDANDFKCPDSTVVNECQLCSEVSGSFHCTKTYFNGTSEDFSGPMSDITSELYMDVMAGLPKPQKCCLAVGNGTDEIRYSFTKKSFATPLNKPVVFPKTGNPDVDCGFGAETATISTLSNFCNVQAVPIKDYDINCSIS
ncbi:MAG TPA: hypothetical protein VLD37_04260 [Candidatus Bilamarchaeum sp.]|nr:hypothetical protein [Candidatus Bilamarchaeum sp.]